MKVFVIIIIGLMMDTICMAQNGCTDYRAINYNATATINDGSCIYPTTTINLVPRFVLDNLVNETSGLINCNGTIWTNVDSDNPNTIYRLDTTNGSVLQSVKINNATNVDWEDIANDSTQIYIADIGNNNGSRTDLAFYNTAKNIGLTDTIATSTKHSFSYTDQNNFAANSNTNFDAEAMLHYKDSLYIFSKNWGNGKTRLYQLNKTALTQSALLLDSFNCNGLITASSISPDGKIIVLLGYLTNGNSFAWLLWDFKETNFFGGNKRRIDFGTSGSQCEGITFLNNHRLIISAEKYSVVPALLFDFDIYKYVQESPLATNNFNTKKSVMCVVNSQLQYNLTSNSIPFCIYNTIGQLMHQGSLPAHSSNCKLPNLPIGSYIITTQQNNTNLLYTIY
jgi:hypothetical protein